MYAQNARQKHPIITNKKMAVVSDGLLLLLLGTAAYTDWKTKTLKLWMLAFGSVAGSLLQLLSGRKALYDLASGALIGLLLLLAAYASRESIGYGDGFLFIATGSFLGWKENLALLFYSLLSAALCSMILLALKRKKRKDPIPFVPFVLAGFDLVLFLRTIPG